ncbi:MAG TPA: NAD(P)H-binding protein [Terriglobales bacterium]|jgi:uncharacterized protein YbjT (DUF2867 family)
MYVIIGATGNTGSVIASKLLTNGKKVRVVGRSAEHLASLTSKGAEAFVANATDKNAITKAFAGAKAVYLMLPPDPATKDYFAYTNQLIDAYASAIEQNGVKYAVVLSSIGADKPSKTGPILGMRNLEQRLNKISSLNALYLRAAYFMENTLGQTDAIALMGYTAGPLNPDLKFPIIATRDIGDFAAGALERLDFTGHQVQDLFGQRDLTYREIATIIGNAMGKPDLKYVQLTSEQFRGVLRQIGMSEETARLLVEMTESMNSGHIAAVEPRSARNSTPTSYETFVKEVLLPIHNKKQKAA